MQPTAARSPGPNLFTSAPTSVTRPDDLVARHDGIDWCMPHSLRAGCRSEWQTPQKRISIRTSRGPVARRSKLNGASGVVALWAAKPLAAVVDARDFGAVVCLMLVISCPQLGGRRLGRSREYP